jgi:hypothetical protein
VTRSASFIAALAIAVGAVTICGPAAAQDLNFGALRSDDRHVLHMGVGVEDAVVASLGYGHVLSLMGRTSLLGGTLDVVPAHASDWRLRLGAVVPVTSHGGWTAGAKTLGILRNARNDMNRMTNLGVEMSLFGGFYAERWFAAADVGVDWATATYIRHTDAYRRLIYEDARDGWYSSTGAALVYGVSGGYSFSNVDIVVRAGQRRDFSFATWLLPFYATVGVDIRLPAFR